MKKEVEWGEGGLKMMQAVPICEILKKKKNNFFLTELASNLFIKTA